MFRRLPSGLPPDPKFPSDLQGLGYFVDEASDEIRSIENPNAYFKYYITKNERWNTVQREMMDGMCALRGIVLERLHALGLEDLRLPLGTKQENPHIPILVSSNISTSKRVIIFIGDYNQDLGVLAYRIVGGTGGVNAGSCADMIKYIQTTIPDTAIIIGNLGQLRWWRRGGKAVTMPSWYALPRKTAVHEAPRFDEIKNTVEGNRNAAQHVNYLMNSVIATLCHPEAVIDMITVSVGSVQMLYFLDDSKNWETWSKRLGGLVMVTPYHRLQELENKALVEWLPKRSRIYVLSEAPLGVPVYGHSDTRNCFGATCYSMGERMIAETILPKGYKIAVDWLKEVREDENYENAEVFILESEEIPDNWGNAGSGDWVNEDSNASDTVVGDVWGEVGSGDWANGDQDASGAIIEDKDKATAIGEKVGPNVVV